MSHATATLEEIQSLQAIYEDDFTCDLASTAGLEAALESLDAGFLKLGQDICFEVKLPLGDDDTAKVAVACTVGPMYPSKLPTFSAVACGSALPAQTLRRIDAWAVDVAEQHREDFHDGAGLFAVFQELGEMLSGDEFNAGGSAVRQSATPTPTSQSGKRSGGGPGDVANHHHNSNNTVKRVLFWTHHVRVKHKTCV